MVGEAELYALWAVARPSRTLLAATVSLALLLGGCVPEGGQALQSSAPPPGMSQAELDLRTKTEQQRKVEGGVAGAIGGAILGGIVGAVVGGNIQSAVIGAAGGAIVGGALGVGYGSYMNAKARTYSNAQARYSAVSQGAAETIAYYNDINASARTILTEQRAKVAQLNQAYRSGTITKEQYREQLASAGPDQNNLNEQIKGIEKQISAMQGDVQASELTQQIQQLQLQRDSLKGTYAQLIQLYGTVPAEVQQQGQPLIVSSR